MGKTAFSMQLTDTQKKIMDYVTSEIFGEEGLSKANVVLKLIREVCWNHLGFTTNQGGTHDINTSTSELDDELLKKIEEKEIANEIRIIEFMGIEQCEKFIEENKKKNIDCSRFESVLKKYKEEKETNE